MLNELTNKIEYLHHILWCIFHRQIVYIADYGKLVKKNYRKNKKNHDRLIKLLKEVTIGEIWYGFTSGGYEHYAVDDDVWNDNIFSGWSKHITDLHVEQDMLETGYGFYATGIPDNDENFEVTISILLADKDGDYSMFANWGDGMMLPVLKLNRNGTETFYERNMRQLEYNISKMKENGTWENRKHWYDSMFEEYEKLAATSD